MEQIKMMVANDNGNSTVKMRINSGQVITSTNVYATVRQMPSIEELNQEAYVKSIDKNLMVAINSKRISGSYLVGYAAQHSGKMLHNMEVGTFSDKVTSEVYPISTLAHIAGQAVKQTEAKQDELSVCVEMIGAIPIGHYSREKAQKLASVFLEGKHIVTVYTPEKAVIVTIKFSVVKILPEGIPPVFWLQQQQQEYKNKRILHINIGEGTTELPLTDDIRFDPHFIRGENLGVGLAVERILPEFQKRAYVSNNYSRQHFMNVVQDKTHKHHNLAMEVLSDELEIEAANILRVAQQELNKANNEVDYIFAYGGGSILMKDTLQPKLTQLAERIGATVIYATEKQAVTIEVNGLNAFSQSNLYQAIRQRHMSEENSVQLEQDNLIEA